MLVEIMELSVTNPNAELPDSYSLALHFKEIKSWMKANDGRQSIIGHLQEKFRLTEAQASAALLEYHHRKDVAKLRISKIWLSIDAVALIVLFFIFPTTWNRSTVFNILVTIGPFFGMALMLSWIMVAANRKAEPDLGHSTVRIILTSDLIGVLSLLLLVVVMLVGILPRAPDGAAEPIASVTWQPGPARRLNTDKFQLSGSMTNSSERLSAVEFRLNVELRKTGHSERENLQINLGDFSVPPGETREYTYTITVAVDQQPLVKTMEHRWADP